jgi:putative solute:sodium symporter small subunit
MNQPTGGKGASQDEILREYWRQNLVIIVIHLVIWALVSYVFGIMLVEPLNKVHLGGFPLGFWFANQGSEVIFVIMIFVYCAFLNRLDRKFDVHE